VDFVVDDAMVRVVVHDHRLVAPLGRGELGEVGLDQPELPHRLEILDLGVHAEPLERLQRGDPPEVLLQVVRLPLVQRDGHPVRLAAVEGGQEAFFGGHHGVVPGWGE